MAISEGRFCFHVNQAWFMVSAEQPEFHRGFFPHDIVHRVPACTIPQQHQFGFATIADWGQFCREAMLEYVLGCSEKTGGPNKTVEIDESKCGRRKYNKGHAVKEKWVFGGVERESGKTFSFLFRTGPPTR